ncbi:ATP-grasp domain-containing protein [Dactylosporangium matsuzakiense]|uniref:Argininosuccinate lyase n=1 Tax=Dactylosporangium matsuzakiense TaxID=53360 RepID=A0A9W6NQP0_9ACTN|nr:ATP-grasp domain-containing protein [Dactylosporangium matsuzakiense]UWZ42305.1 ATP-grasp domain-containing protein [Dactylosporangium matsuzakiense]GLL05322.1 argininosuccinate lyase [Dactylosporangium matsuzakiense]
MSTPWLVLVESNTTGTGRQFCAAARARGLRPIVLASDPSRYPYLDEDGYDRRVLDTADAAAVLQACHHLGDVAGVTSSSEYFIATAAEVATKLGLPSPDAPAVARCRHKDQQRIVLAGAGVPVAGFRLAREPAQAVAAGLGYPVVVKPSMGSGSVGVQLCPDRAAVERHATALLDAPVNERAQAVPRLVLVEQYVTGPEFSVETFDDRVVAVVAKHLGPEPHFVEHGHDVPATVPPAVATALGDTALAAIRALGLGWGAAHTELRLSAGGPVVIEVNPRLAGGMIPALLRLALGVDLVDAVVGRAAGRAVDVRPRPLAHASIRFAVADTPGVVADRTGLDAARATPSVTAAEFTVPVGADLAITHSFRDRFGYAIAAGEDPSTTADRARRAAAELHVVTR